MLYQKHFIDLENIEDEREIAARKEISNVVLKFYEIFSLVEYIENNNLYDVIDKDVLVQRILCRYSR